MNRRILTLIVLTFTFCYGTVVNACVSEGLSVGLVANYKFNNNANDETTTNNATAYNTTSSTDRICSENGAYSFNGTDSYVEKTNPSSALNIGSNNWSISAWVKRSVNMNSYMTIVSRYECGWDCPQDANANYFLGLTPDGSVEFWVRDDNALDKSAITTNLFAVEDGKWYHIVGILDRTASELRIYVNGEKIISTSAVGLSTITDGGSPLEIGRMFIQGWGTPTNYFNGKIDDVRIYNRALTDCEVSELFYKD